MKRPLIALSLLAGLALSLGGCVVIDTKEQVKTFPVPYIAGSPVNVKAHNGHIKVKKAAGAEVQVIATLRMQSDERLNATVISANRDGKGTLVIVATPPDNKWLSSEGCAFDITVPDAVGVTLTSDNGRIEATGLAGAAELKTSNGAIVIQSHDGPVTAESRNGRVEVSSAAGPVRCSTSNGAVKVSLGPSNSGPVQIDTSNGAISLALSRSFAGTISASTSNGSISTPDIESRHPSIDVNRVGARKASVKVGPGGTTSTLSTSNGSISISFTE